jgi:hyperosmotically inducible protein
MNIKMKSVSLLTPLLVVSTLLVTTAPLLASETDSRIEAAAKKSYVFKTYLKDDSITTDSKNGVVTLTGTVADESHKSLARETVASLPGVKEVDDRLVIRGEAPAAHSDGWVALKVKSTLLFHRNVRATKTEVKVKEGIVTLTGEASSAAQKELTTEYVKDVEGVKGVVNDTAVVTAATVTPDPTPGEAIDDASITAQVKLTLASHRSTSALRSKVATMDGIVTLGGMVKNAAEKSLVTKLVTDISGVKSVVNNMVIEPTVSQN